MQVERLKCQDIRELFSKAPKWAAYLAMDSDGELFFFPDLPMLRWKDKYFYATDPRWEVEKAGDYSAAHNLPVMLWDREGSIKSTGCRQYRRDHPMLICMAARPKVRYQR